MDIEYGMEVDKVGRTNQSDLAEIGTFGKERVEGLKGTVSRVVVPTGDVGFQPQTGVEADCLQRIAGL